MTSKDVQLGNVSKNEILEVLEHTKDYTAIEFYNTIIKLHSSKTTYTTAKNILDDIAHTQNQIKYIDNMEWLAYLYETVILIGLYSATTKSELPEANKEIKNKIAESWDLFLESLPDEPDTPGTLRTKSCITDAHQKALDDEDAKADLLSQEV